jgi:sulfonate transport system permease protein
MSAVFERTNRTVRWRAWAVAASGPLLVLVLWWALANSGRFAEQIIVPPREIWAALHELIASGELWLHLQGSFGRLGSGFALGSIAGLIAGVLMAVSRHVEAAVAPIFNAVRQVPSIAFIPMLILIFGIGETFKLLIVAKAAFFAIALATFDGVRNVSVRHLEVAHLFKLGPIARVRYVLAPAALPELLTGIRLGLGRAWGVLVAAELLAADIGIGQMMEAGRQMFRLDVVFVGVIISGAIGYGLDRGLQAAQVRLAPWRTELRA